MKAKGLLLGALVALALPGIAVLPAAHAQTKSPASGTTNTAPREGQRITNMAPHEDQLIQILDTLGLSQGQTASIKSILNKAEEQAQTIRSNTSLNVQQQETMLLSLRKEVFMKVMRILSAAQQQQMIADLTQGGLNSGKTGSGTVTSGTNKTGTTGTTGSSTSRSSTKGSGTNKTGAPSK